MNEGEKDAMRRYSVAAAILVAIACSTYESAVTDLTSTDYNTRFNAVQRLRELRDPRAVEALIGALGDCSIRGDAALALADRRDARAIPPLIEALRIVECFGQRQGPHFDLNLAVALHAVESAAFFEVAAALGAFGSVGFDPVLAAFLNRPELFVGAALALGSIGDARAVDPLIAHVRRLAPNANGWGFSKEDPDSSTRIAIVTALGQLNDPRVVPVLLEALEVGIQDPFLHKLQMAATNALARSKATRLKAIQSLEPLLEQAAGVISLLGPEGRTRLYAALKSPDVRFRVAAAKALGHGTGDTMTQAEEDIDPLLGALDDSAAAVRYAVAEALRPHAAVASVETALAAHLHRQDLAVVSGAMSVFVARGEPGSEPTIIDALTANYDTFGYFNASLLLNCGNSLLEKAAAEWARSHGYSVEQKLPSDRGTPAKWGSR